MTRGASVRCIGWMRGNAESMGFRSGSVGTWTYAHKRILHIGAVVIGLLILTLIPNSTIGSVIGVTVLVLIAVGVIEFLGRPPTSTVVAVDGVAGAPAADPSGPPAAGA